MSDKIKEIRARHEAGSPGEMPIVALAQADADREFLLAEVERLREALRKTACACPSTRECPSPWPSDISGWCQHLNARMALEGKSLERKP